jgi:dCMP deaminase
MATTVISDRELLKLKTYMAMAEDLAELSTCPRKQVGALIMRGGRIVSSGYNGAPPGQAHCTHSRFEPCQTATHAELNAVVFAARHGVATENGILIVTLSPCVQCARLTIAAGIRTVYYREEYRDESGLELLASAGINCWAL